MSRSLKTSRAPIVVVVLVMSLRACADHAAAGQAQVTGSVVGRVTDESGGVLPGVTVTATSPALQVPQVVDVTDEQGDYRLTPLPIGTYRGGVHAHRISDGAARRLTPDRRVYRAGGRGAQSRRGRGDAHRVRHLDRSMDAVDIGSGDRADQRDARSQSLEPQRDHQLDEPVACGALAAGRWRLCNQIRAGAARVRNHHR